MRFAFYNREFYYTVLLQLQIAKTTLV